MNRIFPFPLILMLCHVIGIKENVQDMSRDMNELVRRQLNVNHKTDLLD